MVNKIRNSKKREGSFSIRISSFKKILEKKFDNFNLYLKRRKYKSKDSKSSSNTKYPSIISKRLLLVIIGIIPAVIILLFLFKYLSYTPVTFENTPVRDVNLTQRKDTVAFIVANYSNLGYTYFDSITIIDRDFDTNLAKLYTLNTSFIPPMAKGYSLKTLLNTIEDEQRINIYLEYLERVLGIKVNRYLIYDRSDLKDTIRDRLSAISVDRNLSFPTKTIDINSRVEVTEAFDLLNNASNTNDSQTYLYGLVTKSFLQSFRQDFLGMSLILNSENIFSGLQTDMNREELFSYLNSLGGFQILFDYNSMILTAFGEKFESSDEFIPNYSKLDENIKFIFRDFEVIKEQQRIEVYNSTSRSGVASVLQRFIANRGGNVIKIGNFPERFSETTVYLNLERLDNFKATIRLLESILGSDVKIKSITEYPNNYSGDITIVIGENYIQ